MLYVVEGSWVYRVFLWALQYRAAFTRNTSLVYQHEYRTNLCFLVRVIALYVPLITAIRLATLGGIMAAFLGVPIWLFSARGFGLFLLWPIGFFAVFMIGFWIHDSFSVKVSADAKRQISHFGHVAQEYLLAKKSKLCPLVEFQKGKMR
jgi:hypothetical protein